MSSSLFHTQTKCNATEKDNQMSHTEFSMSHSYVCVLCTFVRMLFWLFVKNVASPLVLVAHPHIQYSINRTVQARQSHKHHVFHCQTTTTLRTVKHTNEHIHWCVFNGFFGEFVGEHCEWRMKFKIAHNRQQCNTILMRTYNCRKQMDIVWMFRFSMDISFFDAIFANCWKREKIQFWNSCFINAF